MSSDDQLGISKPILLVIAVVVIILIGGAAFFFKVRIDKLTSQPSPTPFTNTATNFEPQPTAAPTPEPFDRESYTLRILNGTETGGLAASVSAKLKDLGYQVERTGNATSSAIAQTTVRAKAGKDDLIAQLIKDLSPDYQAASGSALKASDDSDAEIIIGAK